MNDSETFIKHIEIFCTIETNENVMFLKLYRFYIKNLSTTSFLTNELGKLYTERNT